MKKALFVLILLFPACALFSEHADQILFSQGAKTSKWGSIGIIQSNLRLPASGTFGEQTKAALLEVQSTLNLMATGQLDSKSWKILTNRALPNVQERSEALTFNFEGTDLDQWEWNYGYDHKDPSGATWGPMGLTVLYNEIQPIFREIQRTNPQFLRSIFGSQSSVVRDFMWKSGTDAKSYLKKKIYDSRSKRAAWIQNIRKLAANRQVRAIYLKKGRSFFVEKMKNLNDAYPVRTELDYAFYWDLSVHTSGLTPERKEAIDSELRLHPPETPAQRRAVIGKVFVETLGNSTQRRARTDRNSVYVEGNGKVYGTKVDASAYGLAERPFTYSGSVSVEQAALQSSPTRR